MLERTLRYRWEWGIPHHLKPIPGQHDTEVVAANFVSDDDRLRPNDAYDGTVPIDRAVHELAADHFDYRHPLDPAEVEAFVARIGSGSDGIRD